MMEKRGNVVMLLFLMSLVSSLTSFQGCSAELNQLQSPLAKSSAGAAAGRIGSTAVFPIYGNVYPIGYYYVALSVGNPAKPYYLDIDTGSDLTWLQCDAPCVSCSKVPHPLYRPNKNGIVFCPDPICKSLQSLHDHKCENPHDQCDYDVEYADDSSSFGVLVRDVFPLQLINGTLFKPRLAFGCGYDQHVPRGTTSPTDGVFGLGNGKSSIVSQLWNMGLTRNVIGHCLSGQGGGFLFIGEDPVPRSGLVWTSMSQSSSHEHYSPGTAELIFGKQSTGVKGPIIFDSGSTYTYFNSQAYKALISLLTKDLSRTPLKAADHDKTLSVCWKGLKPFKSILDVKTYFKTLTLSFTNGKKAQLEIPPEAYLIISSRGNVCLGILNGSEIGQPNLNIVGDISFQDRIVIYDNEKQQIGWAPADCSRVPKSGKFLLQISTVFQGRKLLK